MDIIMLICTIVGALILGVTFAAMLIFIVINVGAYVEERRNYKNNLKNGNLGIKLTDSWKDKTK